MHRRLRINAMGFRPSSFFSLLKPTKLKLLVLLLVLGVIGFFAFSSGKKAVSEEVKVDRTVVVSQLHISVDRLEITRQVNVNGSLFKAPNAKRFLIAHLYVNNTADQVLNAQLVKLFRLVDDKDRKFAPDLYNKITSIQPGATKSEQVGFVIPSNSSKFKLQVGDVSSEKTTIEINIPKTN